jgi:hypothetical protein
MAVAPARMLVAFECPSDLLLLPSAELQNIPVVHGPNSVEIGVVQGVHIRRDGVTRELVCRIHPHQEALARQWLSAALVNVGVSLATHSSCVPTS